MPPKRTQAGSDEYIVNSDKAVIVRLQSYCAGVGRSVPKLHWEFNTAVRL